MSLEEKIEQAFRKQEPGCLSCGWGACFYELGPWYETDTKNEFNAGCVSQDDPEGCGTHEGVFVYLEQEKE